MMFHRASPGITHRTRFWHTLIHLWSAITDPSPALHEPEERRRARLLASALLLFGFLDGMLVILTLLFGADFFALLGIITFLAMAGAFFLSRTVYFILGAAIVLVVITVMPLAAVLADPTQIYVLAYLANSILFSILFFSRRVIILLVACELTAFAALGIIRPEINPLHLLILAVFILTGSTLVITVNAIRRQDQLQRDAQARAIADSELRYRLIAENATDWICRHQLDTTYLYASPACRQLLGYDPEELLGHSPYEYIHPDDIETVRESHYNVLASDETDIMIYRFRRKDGTYIWFESTSKTVRDPQTGTPWEMITVSRDVTERKMVEDVLYTSEARFRAAAEGSLDAFYLFQAYRDESEKISDFIFVDLNTRGAQLMGMSYQQVIGQRLCELLPFNRTNGFFDKYVRVVETGIPFEEEFPNKFPEIRAEWLHHQVIPVGDGIAITSRDVTQRKRAEENIRQTSLRLEASRDTLQRLMQQMPIGIQVFDTEGLCTDANQAYLEIFGVASREQVIGKFNIFRNLGQNATSTKILDAFRRASSGHIAELPEAVLDFSQADHRFSSRNDSLVITVSFFPIYDENRTIVSVVALNRDVTERKLAEAALQMLTAELLQQKNMFNAVLSTTPDQLAIFDREGRYLYINPPGLATLGVEMAVVQDKTWRELGAPQEMGEKFDREREQVFTTGQPLTGWHVFPSVNGPRDFEYTFSPVLDSEGKVILMVSTTRDVTEQRQAEQERFELALQRERVNMLQHLISDTSHDLKTPLATLNTGLYLLKKSITDPERRDHYAQILQAQVTNLTKILEDMDSMARLDRASEAFVFEPVDLNALVRQIVMEHETLASAKNQRLRFEAGESIPALAVDSTKLRRAITNLVTNALHYTSEGGQIDARTFRRDSSVAIEVRDNGIGIPQEELAFIFDRFYRSEESRQSYSEGSGLGLAISKKIVEAHGGSIEVESKPGEGSAFRIVLPVVNKTTYKIIP